MPIRWTRWPSAIRFPRRVCRQRVPALHCHRRRRTRARAWAARSPSARDIVLTAQATEAQNRYQACPLGMRTRDLLLMSPTSGVEMPLHTRASGGFASGTSLASSEQTTCRSDVPGQVQRTDPNHQLELASPETRTLQTNGSRGSRPSLNPRSLTGFTTYTPDLHLPGALRRPSRWVVYGDQLAEYPPRQFLTSWGFKMGPASRASKVCHIRVAWPPTRESA